MQQMNVGQYGYSITSSASSCIVFGMVNPQRIRGFLVEHHFEFGGLQDWKIGRLRPPQNSV
jgi:hypothetical protein